jgi:hypothetical protein
VLAYMYRDGTLCYFQFVGEGQTLLEDTIMTHDIVASEPIGPYYLWEIYELQQHYPDQFFMGGVFRNNGTDVKPIWPDGPSDDIISSAYWGGPRTPLNGGPSSTMQIHSHHQNPLYRTVAFTFVGLLVNQPWAGPILEALDEFGIDSKPAGWRTGDQVLTFTLIVDGAGAVQSRVFIRDGSVIKTQEPHSGGLVR